MTDVNRSPHDSCGETPCLSCEAIITQRVCPGPLCLGTY